ncbi:MAG TPA: PAS domain S-box protein [Gaiellaceae bacterium]|nr:PAS domain S-box protein [Gaiellaceae bacterium]
MAPRPLPVAAAPCAELVPASCAACAQGEEVFRALAAHTPVGIFLSDAEGRCVYVNRRWCELAGLDPDGALGDGWMRALHPEDEARVRTEWAEASRTGRPSVIEYRFRRPDDSVVPIEGFASPLRDGDGRLTGWVGTCLDLTDRRRAEAALREANRRVRDAFDNAPVGVALLGPDGRWTHVNEALCQLLGYGEDELLRMSFLDVTHPDDREQSVDARRRQLDGSANQVRLRKRYIRADGEVVHVSITSTLVRSEEGVPLYTVAVIEDVTAQVRAEEAEREAEERFRRSFEDAPIGMALVGLDGRFLRVNGTLVEIAGCTEAELLARTFQELMHPDDLEKLSEHVRRLLGGEVRSSRMEARCLRKGGDVRWVMLSASAVRDVAGTALYLVVQAEDIGERKTAEAELELLASYDPLTGLGNRRKLIADLERRLATPQVEPFGFAIFDLNGFKTYNDLFGHPAGDTMLVRLAHALAAAAGDDASAYRIGGDEFCLVAPGRPELVFAHAQTALTARGEWFTIEAEYGHVYVPEEAQDVSSALQVADGRLYARKRGARTTAPQQARDALMQVMLEQDPLLSGHVRRVADLAEATARRLDLDEEEVWHVRLAAELHDVGKAAVPEMLLDKPTALDENEWSFIRRHTLIGERIVSAAPALGRVGRLIRASHERPDGSGYPDGLVGDQIPLGARIVAVADAFDAMISDRPYSRARSPEQAIAELERCAGTQFDPAVVDAFVEEVRAMLATERSGRPPSGAPPGRALGAPAEPDGRPSGAVVRDLGAKRLERILERARARHWEQPHRAGTVAKAVARRALARADSSLYGRALVVEAQVATRLGRLDRAFELLEAARAETRRSGAVELRAELTLAQSRLSFLAGMYDDALAQIEEAVALADTYHLDELRLAARRGITLVLGNIESSDQLRTATRELLALAIELGDRKEEAMARNDLAYTLLLDGDVKAARGEIERAILLASELRTQGTFCLAYAYATRADIRLAAGDAAGAIADCDRSLELAHAGDDPEPYLTAMTVFTKISALVASGELEVALRTGRAELARLDQDLPHARSRILRTLANALAEGGRMHEAFQALQESADLDRATFEQLSGRRLDLQRAALEAKAARHEAQVLAAESARLGEFVTALDARQAAQAGRA